MRRQWDVYNPTENPNVPLVRVTTQGGAASAILRVEPITPGRPALDMEGRVGIALTDAMQSYRHLAYRPASGPWPPHPGGLHRDLAAFLDATSATPVPDEDVDRELDLVCELDEIVMIVSVDEAAHRLTISAYLIDGDETDVSDWVERQPPPTSGLLFTHMFIHEHGERGFEPELYFERPLGHDWLGDSLIAELELYRRAWNDGEDVHPDPGTPAYVVTDDPRQTVAQSAWLLTGDRASFPTSDDLDDARAAALAGCYVTEWTAASTTRRGDLVIVYFVAPDKAAHFVARAASDAWFSRETPVTTKASVSTSQWWAVLTPLVQIEPIPVTALRAATADSLILQGRSGIYLRPDAITSLAFRAVDPRQQAEVDALTREPSGLADLPAPESMTFEQWRAISPGALRLEADVSSHIVEPLLRLAMVETSLDVRREFPVGRGWADFVICGLGGRPSRVIEVKKRIRRNPSLPWTQCADFNQVSRYATALGVPAMLIDAQQLLLIQQDATAPTHVFTRETLTPEQMTLIGQHLRPDGRRRPRMVP